MKSRFLCAAGLVLITVLAYLPVMRAGFVFDDNLYVTENAAVKSPDGLRRIWCDLHATPQYYPLVFTSFWLEHKLYGLSPVGYHVDNILLHALNAVLLWALLRRLSVRGAWVVAAIFALHPVQVESVAWVGERKNLLSTAFYLSAFLAWPNLWLTAGLFACALLSKTATCTLPAAMLLVLWWQHGKIERRDFLRTLPLFALAIATGLVTLRIESTYLRGDEVPASWLERVLIAGRALWFYAGKLAWPANLTFIYPRWQIDPRISWQWIFPVAFLALVIALWRFRQRGALAAVLFFAGTLSPALGFFNMASMWFSFVADHFQYIACIGLIALVVAGLPRWLPILPLCICGVLTWQQSQVYRNGETFWRDNVRKNPASFLGYFNLGNELFYRGQSDEALRCYQESVRLNPNFAEGHYNFANLLLSRHDNDAAIAHYSQAIRLDASLGGAHWNLGNLLAGLGRPDEAIAHLSEAVRLRPNDAAARNNLAVLLDNRGQIEEAMRHYEIALNINPSLPETHNNLAIDLEAQGKYAEAIEHFSTALRLKPDYEAAARGLRRVLARTNSATPPVAQSPSP